MRQFIFLTMEGFTEQPDGEDIENLQVIGFAEGKNAKKAFDNLLVEYSFLKETSFDKIFSFELEENYRENKEYFYWFNNELCD